MTNVWFASDLHIGHESIAQYRRMVAKVGWRAWRSSTAVEWHDDHLALNWDSCVAPEDTVWVLGDLSAGGSAAERGALEWIAARHGTKHLIAGNHDSCHPSRRDAHTRQAAFLGAFASVQPYARRRIAGHTVLLSHFPYTGDHTAEDRYPQYRLPDHGEILLHGHTHSHHQQHGRQIHVGADAWQLAPASLNQITALITRTEP